MVFPLFSIQNTNTNLQFLQIVWKENTEKTGYYRADLVK